MLFRTIELKKAAVCRTLLGLAAIPVGLLTARVLAAAVTAAVAGDTAGVLRAAWRLPALLLGWKAAETLGTWALALYESRALHRCRLAVYEAWLSGPLARLYAQSSGEARERLHDDFRTVTDKTVKLLPQVLTGAVTAVVYFAYISRLSVPAALLLTALGLVQLLPPFIVKRFLEKNYEDTREIEADLTNLILEAYNGLSVIKLCGLEDWYEARLQKLHKAYLKIGNNGIFAATAQRSMRQFVTAALKFGAYALAGLFILHHLLPLDGGVQVVALSASFFAALKGAFGSVADFAVAKKAEGRLADWADTPGPDTGAGPQDGGLTLSNVTLLYEDKTVLDCFNAALPETGLYVLHGPNGSGKSSVLKLLTGLLLPDGGTVRAGGSNPAAFPEDTFPRRFFYLPQEDAVFDLTPAVLYGMAKGLDAAKAEAVARDLGLTDAQLSETDISSLSGGERKKVWLAMALASEAGYLLLDEPTNDLDAASRTRLCELLKNRPGLTVVVTHDPVFDAAGRSFLVKKGGLVREA